MSVREEYPEKELPPRPVQSLTNFRRLEETGMWLLVIALCPSAKKERNKRYTSSPSKKMAKKSFGIKNNANVPRKREIGLVIVPSVCTNMNRQAIQTKNEMLIPQ
jgi:hypothetical protein